MRKFILIFHILFICPVIYGQTLDDYFKIAAENNPSLKSAFTEYEVALQKIPQASALQDPTFSFGYFISPVETRVGAQQAKFSLSQMFPWFGTLKANKNYATLEAESKFQNFIDLRNKLHFDISSAYYALYEVRKFQEIEKENINLLESYKRISSQRYSNGKGNMVNVLRVDILINESEANLNNFIAKEKPLVTKFNLLLNRDKNELVNTETSDISILNDDFKTDENILNNPLIKAIDLKVESSKAKEVIAHKNALPKIGLGVDYVLVRERSDMDMIDNGKDVLMPMVSISIPIFSKKNNAAIKEAQLLQKSFTQKKESLINNLITEYEMNKFTTQEQLNNLSLYKKQVDVTQKSLDLLVKAYSHSGNDFEEVLRTQQLLLNFKKMYVTAQIKYNTAVEKINYLTAKYIDSYEQK